MLKVPNYPDLWESGVDGQAPAVWFGNEAPDGDARPFTLAPVGSLYIQNETTPTHWIKTTDAGRDSDWSAAFGVVAQRVTYDQFTDGGSTAGTKTLTGVIPVGAIVTKTIISDVTGFAGDTSAVLTIGDGTDVDRYNTSTLNVFADVAAIDGGAISGTAVHTAAKNPVLTITSGSDWGLVTAGALTVKIFYMK